jgi:hypothetical protein
VAAAVSADLHGIVASLGGSAGTDPAQVVDEQHRVKGLASLARKFAEAFESRGTEPDDFLAEVNDRVRFSIQTSEQGYGETVQQALDMLRDLGYEIDPDEDIKNFWEPGNRHNGVNVTARTPDGFVIEIQFPTEVSRSLGKQTHDLYEIIRLTTADPAARVEAFLEILQLNKQFGISQQMPEGLESLPPAVDTSLARWVERNPEVWAEYQQMLEEQGRTFADVVAERGLYPGDFPRAERLGLGNDDGQVRLPRSPEGQDGPGTVERDRGLGAGGQAPVGGDVERAAEGVDLRSGDSGGPALRRPVSEGSPSDRPDDGGTDLPGEPPDRTSERGEAPGDLRGGRETGPGLGSTQVQPEPGVDTRGPETAAASTHQGTAQQGTAQQGTTQQGTTSPTVAPPSVTPPPVAPPSAGPTSGPPPAPGTAPTPSTGPTPSGPTQARAQVAAANSSPVYNPSERSDEELQDDLDPTPRPGETTDQAASRVWQADEELELREYLARYEALGDQPPLIRIAENDAAHQDAHTDDHHGPGIAIWRAPGIRTLEGRIYGDQPWNGSENWSYGWLDEATMNRTVNSLLRDNWETIRSDLAMSRRSDGTFDAGVDIGHGFFNRGMYGTGPRRAQYSRTTFVTLRLRLVPNADPPEMFVLTAFPAGVPS